VPTVPIQTAPRRAFVRSLSLATLALALPMAMGCDRAAKEQAERAKGDLARAETIAKDKHVAPLAEALPKAAEALAAAKDRPAAFTAYRDKNEALRSAKRSWYALVDAAGVVTWVEDPDWNIVERKLKGGFPAVAEVLDGKKPYASGAGRFGDEGPEALTFVSVAKISGAGGAIDGALIAGWDAREAAGDLQRQLATDAKMSIAAPKRRVKDADRLQLALDTPQIWIGVFAQDGALYLPYGVPQTLEDAIKGAAVSGKDAGGWIGVVKVTNASWGMATKRVDALWPGYGLVVVRNQ
jgi:hypothetical protein